MKFSMYDHTPRRKSSKSVKGLFVLCFLLFIIFTLVSFLSFYYSWILGITIILVIILFTATVLIAIKDIEKAYVEIMGEEIYVVEYIMGIKKEKYILFSDITSAEICNDYSPKLKGYRLSAATQYIVFYSGKKYLFQIICLPETAQAFKQFIQ